MSTAFDGEHSNEVSDGQLGLAYAEAHSGHAGDAEALCRSAMVSFLMKHPESSYLVQRAKMCLGDALVEQKRYAEAEPLLLTARDVMAATRAGARALASANATPVRAVRAPRSRE